jgi:hypothetical protein
MLLLRNYDPDMARLLARQELPPFVWCFRWISLLFAQDLTLPDVIRLWDSLVADPLRFQFVMYVAVAAVLEKREELLRPDVKQFALVEALQSAPRDADFSSLLRRAWAICAFERRAQTPPFPVKSALQVLENIVDVDQAVAVANEVKEEVARTIQTHIAPMVKERAEQASTRAASAAQDVQAWLQETAPARQQAYEKAHTQFSSLWEKVKSTGADAVSKAAEYTTQEDETAAESKSSRLSAAAAEHGATAAAATASAASRVSQHAASLWGAASAAWEARKENTAEGSDVD